VIKNVPWILAFRKTEIALLWTLFALIGWLQMQHKHVGFLTSQGADVVAPALLFVLTRDGKSLLRFIGLRQDRPAVIAAGVFGLSLAWEVCQKLQWIPGVFDPMDIVAYAVGVAVPFMLDRWLTHLEDS
jgi:hypothetical protein